MSRRALFAIGLASAAGLTWCAIAISALTRDPPADVTGEWDYALAAAVVLLVPVAEWALLRFRGLTLRTSDLLLASLGGFLFATVIGGALNFAVGSALGDGVLASLLASTPAVVIYALTFAAALHPGRRPATRSGGRLSKPC